MNSKDKHRRVFFYITLTIVILLSLMVVFPFLKSLAAAALMAYIFYPVFKAVNNKIKKPSISALLVLILVVIIIFAPFAFILNELVKESTVAYIAVKQKILNPPEECPVEAACFFVEEVKNFLTDPKVQFYLVDSLEKFTTFIAFQASNFLVSLPKAVISIFIWLLSFFYFLRDGKEILRKLKKTLPMRKEFQDKLLTQFGNVSKAIVFGYIITAIIQGVVALLGFYLVNIIFAEAGTRIIDAPILWASILALFAMIPVLGSGIVWVPLSLFLLIEGYFTGSSTILMAGVFIFFYGLIVVSNIDNILRPILAGKKAKVHSLLIFLGVLGGLFVMGIVGIFLGPLILALLVTYLKVYEERKI